MPINRIGSLLIIFTNSGYFRRLLAIDCPGTDKEKFICFALFGKFESAARSFNNCVKHVQGVFPIRERTQGCRGMNDISKFAFRKIERTNVADMERYGLLICQMRGLLPECF